jgi:hypothetical protein
MDKANANKNLKRQRETDYCSEQTEKKRKLRKETRDEEECFRFMTDITFAETSNCFSAAFLLFTETGDLVDVDLTDYLAFSSNF